MHVATGPLDTALASVARTAPKLLGFVAILVGGWVAAILLRRLTARLLRRIDLRAALERGGLSGPGYDPVAVLARGVYYAVLLIALTLAFGLFGRNPVTDMLAGVLAFLPKAAIAAVIVLTAAAVARAVRDLVTGLLGDLHYGRVLANVAGAFIIGLGVVAALGQIGVATAVTTPLLISVLATVGGILVVGVGGGLIRPMQRRWERWLDAAEREARTISHTVARKTANADPHAPADQYAPYEEPAEHAHAEQSPAVHPDAHQGDTEAFDTGQTRASALDDPTEVFAAIPPQA